MSSSTSHLLLSQENPFKPQIVIQDTSGFHNTDSQKSAARLERAHSYKDLSTVCVVPTRGMVPAKAVQSWMNLMPPMNQKFVRMFVIGMEVGAAYTQAVEAILAHPELSKFKYLFTLEEDNMPPPDGLLKLYEDMDEFDAVGGLYWTKGEGGQPMIYGNPDEMPMNFIPQIPRPDQLQRANGLGMGFNLFKMDIFKNPDLPKPFFKTQQSFETGVGSKAYTQDLYFYENIKKLGYKVACDTRIKVGHYDVTSDIIW